MHRLLISRIKFTLVKLLAALLAPVVRHRVPTDCRDTRNFLLIRNDGLGDYLLFLPAARRFREAFPNHKIILFSAVAADLAQTSPYFDKVIPISITGTAPTLREVLLFSVFPAEILVNTLHARNAGSDIFAAVSHAKQKIAFSLDALPCLHENDREKLHFYESFYTRLTPFLPAHPIRELNGALMNLAADEKISDFSYPEPEKLFPFAFDESFPKKRFEFPYFVIVPGAADPRRRWPAASFRQAMIRLLSLFPDCRPVLVGTADEAPLAEQILEGVANGLNLCGTLSLFRLGEVLAGAKFVLSNDTGSAHYASLLGTETFIILGGGHFGTYLPDSGNIHAHELFQEKPCFQCGWFCSQCGSGVYPCIAAIPPDVAATAVESFFKEERT